MRRYEPSKLPGVAAPYRTIKERRALIGKRVAYDLTYSPVPHFGVVTDAYGAVLEVDGSEEFVSRIEQLHVVEKAA